MPLNELFRVLALISDGFGGRGGIAKFNRDLLDGFAAMPECEQVVALPRTAPPDFERSPPGVTFLAAVPGKLAYAGHAIAQIRANRSNLVICGHINMAPLAVVLAKLANVRSLLVVHGIDAWARHRSALVCTAVRHFDRVLGVSQFTLTRFLSWSGIDSTHARVLPNCVDLSRYSPGPKSTALVESLGIEGRTVLMTVGRLVSPQRAKGIDEVLEALPALINLVPNVVYVVVGDGPDRTRLEAKATALRVYDRVRFVGYIPEESKADYYRLADAYVMPSRGEGFGIVFLEAMACGVPVMGSRVDGSREALLGGGLGVLVDPSNGDEVVKGILETLSRRRGVPKELEQFSSDQFRMQLSAFARELMEDRN